MYITKLKIKKYGGATLVNTPLPQGGTLQRIPQPLTGSSGERPYYSYELSVCLSEGVWGWGSKVWGLRAQSPGVLKNAVLVRNFSNSTTWRGDMGGKLHF